MNPVNLAKNVTAAAFLQAAIAKDSGAADLATAELKRKEQQLMLFQLTEECLQN